MRPGLKSAFARQVLNKQLGAVALLNPFEATNSDIDIVFNDIWANNGNGWSDPVHFTFGGYDTSLVFDDGKVYVLGSHYWRVSPGIMGWQIDLETGQSLSGDPQLLWTGTGGLV